MNTPESDLSEALLELNFVPAWARAPAGSNPYRDEGPAERRRAPARRSSEHRRRDDRSRPPARRPYEPRAPRRERRRAPPPEEERRPLPFEVHFVPEIKHLAAVVRRLRAGGCAYPLPEIAALFLSDPQGCLVKIECRRAAGGAERPVLYQCRQCKAPFLEESAAQTHALEAHARDFFEEREIEMDPPSGSFACIGVCRRSGEVLGPPNWHGFQERLKKLHRERFAHLSLDAYRGQIEQLHEAERIEAWKESMRRQTRYRLKGGDDEAPFELTWEDVEREFQAGPSRRLVRPTERAVLPARVAQGLPAGALKSWIEYAWRRESRHPQVMMYALRAALRHHRLHCFKAGAGIPYVTPYPPHPLATDNVAQDIAKMMALLAEKPGSTRADVLQVLQPDLPPESPEARAVLRPLQWLIEKGHVVAFYNGALAIPQALRFRNDRKPG